MFVKSGFISTSLNESFADFFQNFLWLQPDAEKLAAFIEFRNPCHAGSCAWDLIHIAREPTMSSEHKGEFQCVQHRLVVHRSVL